MIIMGEIRKKIKIMFGGRTATVNALIDSGATDNFIKPKFINDIQSSGHKRFLFFK